ncbi:hypothetical protein MXD81_31375 [Microbacteriaceae bacterium K1510]|nr:hypothetical protein [Microbacteriaceae bacterium K1510]
MATDYKAGRQHEHLAMDGGEFNRRLGAIDAAFGAAWLTTSDASLAGLWQRTDAFAVNQLCLLGDAIAGFNSTDPKWVREHVAKIKGTEANSRRGSMFELLGANLFRAPRQTIKPTKSNNPGYDAVLTTQDGGIVDISMKGYGTSAHEVAFREKAVLAETAFRKQLAERKEGGVFFAIAKSHPTAADWEELRGAIAGLSREKTAKIGIWAVKLGPLPPDYAPYAETQISYQVSFAGPFHKNESKNLSDKFDTAFANATKHAVATPNGVRVVLMRVPETMPLLACDGWAKEYLANHPASPIDGVYLYQIATIDRPDGSSVIGHSLAVTETARFRAWRKSRKSKPALSMNFAVGVPVHPSRLQVTNGSPQIPLADGYYHQRGDFFTAYKADPKKPTDAWLRNLASGIFQHAVIVHPGREDVWKGVFPPTKDIGLFD